MPMDQKKKFTVIGIILLSIFLVAGTGGLFAFAAENPLVGTWGGASLEYENQPLIWYAESFKVTFNGDGSGTLSGIKNDEMNDPGDRIKPFGFDFTYTLADNGDGSYTISIVMEEDGEEETMTMRAVMSDNGNMVLIDGTTDPAWVSIRALVKIDTTRTYGNADVSGEYYGLGYEHTSGTVVDPPDGNGAYMAISSIHTFSGTGNYNYEGRANSIFSTGSIKEWDDFGFDEDASYSVGTDGTVSVQGAAFRGYVTGKGAMALGSGSFDTAEPDSRVGYFFLKKHDRDYTQADLAGTWVVSDFGDEKDEDGQSISAGFGVMTCDASGNCLYNHTIQWNGATSTDVILFHISVGSDGGFGLAPDSQINVPVGAIGNDGNTVLFNPGLAFGDNSMRRIVVGIKASNAANVSSQKIFAQSVHDTIGGSSAYYGSFLVLDPEHSLTEVTVTGPGAELGMSLVYREDMGQWWTVNPINYGEAPPADKTYAITLKSEGGEMTLQKTISGGVEAFATPLSPSGNINSGDITFSFNGIDGADHYRITVAKGSDPAAGGEIKWISDPIYSVQETINIPYTGGRLSPGPYNYAIHAMKGENKSIARAGFNLPPKLLWLPLILE